MSDGVMDITAVGQAQVHILIPHSGQSHSLSGLPSHSELH